MYKLHDTYSGITDELYTDLGGTGPYGKRIDAAGSLGKAIPEKLEQREFESIVPTTMNWNPEDLDQTQYDRFLAGARNAEICRRRTGSWRRESCIGA